jgi:hypothetical protein
MMGGMMRDVATRINCTSENVEIRKKMLMITINYFYGFGFCVFEFFFLATEAI